MKFFWRAGVAAAVVLAGGAACAERPSPFPSHSPDATASATVPFDCAPQNTKINWLDGSRTKVLTSAVRLAVEPRGGTDHDVSEKVVVPDKPITPAVTGFAGAQSWLERLAADYLTAQKAGMASEASSRMGDARTLSGGNAKIDGIYIVYMGVEHINAGFTITCASPQRQVAGTAVAWDSSTGGVLACTRNPPNDSYGALAKQYC